MEDWRKVAVEIVSGYISENTKATTEVIAQMQALFFYLESLKRPAAYNTQFAIVSHFNNGHLTGLIDTRTCAWRMVLNGIGRFWQWETTECGNFSIEKATRKLGLLLPQENPDEFSIDWNGNPQDYCKIHPDFIKRIVNFFDLPVIHGDYGKRSLTVKQRAERAHFMEKCTGAKEAYKSAISMI